MTSVVFDSGASCNVMDKATWETLKQSRVKCTLQTTGNKLFAYEQDKPIEVIGTFVSEIECEANESKCFGEFIKGVGKTLLGRSTAEKLDVFRVGSFGNTHAYPVAEEGVDAVITESRDVKAMVARFEKQIKAQDQELMTRETRHREQNCSL